MQRQATLLFSGVSPELGVLVLRMSGRRPHSDFSSPVSIYISLLFLEVVEDLSGVTVWWTTPCCAWYAEAEQLYCVHRPAGVDLLNPAHCTWRRSQLLMIPAFSARLSKGRGGFLFLLLNLLFVALFPSTLPHCRATRASSGLKDCPGEQLALLPVRTSSLGSLMSTAEELTQPGLLKHSFGPSRAGSPVILLQKKKIMARKCLAMGKDKGRHRHKSSITCPIPK